MLHAPHPPLRIVHSQNQTTRSSRFTQPLFPISTSCQTCSKGLLPNTLLIDLEVIGRHDPDALQNIQNVVAHARALIVASAGRDAWADEDDGTDSR